MEVLINENTDVLVYVSDCNIETMS